MKPLQLLVLKKIITVYSAQQLKLWINCWVL